MNNPEVSDVLEAVTRTLESLGTVLGEVAKAVNRHGNMLQNVEHNVGGIDSKVRTLESQVYAQAQELKELKDRHNALAQSFNWHSHPAEDRLA